MAMAMGGLCIFAWTLIIKEDSVPSLCTGHWSRYLSRFYQLKSTEKNSSFRFQTMAIKVCTLTQTQATSRLGQENLYLQSNNSAALSLSREWGKAKLGVCLAYWFLSFFLFRYCFFFSLSSKVLSTVAEIPRQLYRPDMCASLNSR